MKNVVKAVCVALSGLGVVGGICALAIPVHDTIEITQFSWTWTEDIYEYKTKRSSGWSVPSGGRMISVTTREKDRIKTLVGTDSNGNNKYVETPVYAPYYEYEYDDWVFKTNIISCGNDKDPYFKDVNLIVKEEGKTSIGDEKIGKTHMQFYIHGKNSKGVGTTYEVSEDQWYKMELGGKVKVKHFRFNNDVISFDFL